MLPVFVSAQTQTSSTSFSNKLDSLHMVLNNAANDTLRMDAYFNLGIYYLERNRDSAVYYANKSIALARQLKLKLNEAGALSLKGYSQISLGNYPESLKSISRALKIAEDPASEKYTWNLPKGKTAHWKRLDQLGFTNLHFGHLYGATGNTNKQKLSYFKSLGFAESVRDTFLLGLANWALGGIYSNLNKLDSALLFEQKALQLQPYLAFVNRMYEGLILYDIGNIYLKKRNLTLAQDAYLKSVKSLTEHYNLNYIQSSYDALRKLYEKLNKSDSGLFYARKSMEIARVLGLPQQLAISYQGLSDFYSNRENRDSTLKYLQLYTALNDSLNNAEKKNLLSYQNIGFDEQMRLMKLEEESAAFKTKIKTNTLLGSLFTLLIIAFFLYRNNRNRKRANDLLQDKNVEIEKQKKNVEQTLTELKSTQAQLIQSEKMASMGELTAGIAHEIQNPLNFVNNFSEVNRELIEELKVVVSSNDQEGIKEILQDLAKNEDKVIHHGMRADTIVKSMLQHSRTSNGVKEPTDINAICDEYLRLAFHGMRAKDKSFNAEFKTDLDPALPNINIVSQDIGRVLLNLINNAFQAVSSKSRHRRGKEGSGYIPEVIVSTKMLESKVEIRVSDNGPGIPVQDRDKIFQPFFTTKPTGQGTGLGLSLSYDIIKAHGGEIKIETSENKGSEFIIQLPVKM